MCGLFGVVRKDQNVDESLFSMQLDSMHSRGPDAQGSYFDKNVGIGLRRLAIIDLSSAGTQPMHSENKDISLVFNGEIYNYLAVKAKLTKKHVWESKTDTEVLVHAFEEIGTGIFDLIEGMFGLCIYDKKAQQVILARDHFGKKPMYYYLDDDTLYFASELKAILKDKQIKSKLKISQSSLHKYLSFGFIPAPHTIYENVHKIEASTYMVFDIKKWQFIEKKKYWSLEKTKIQKKVDYSQVLDDVSQLLDASVKKRLMADVPLGVFLSGGLDSSLIAHYLAKYSPKVNSFTIRYKNSPEADESQHAKFVAKKLGIKYNLCNFENKHVLNDFIEISNYIDEPFVDAAVIPLYHMSKFAKPKITVVLSGDGGDEIFGGYAKYIAQKFIEDYTFLGGLASIATNFVDKKSGLYKMADAYKYSFAKRQYFFGTGSFYPEELAQLLKVDHINDKTLLEDVSRYEKLYKWDDVTNKSMFIDCKMQLPEWYLVKGDRATMAASLEMRNPMLDKELAEYMFSLSGEYKVKHGRTKRVLKDIGQEFFGKDFVNRKKSGFGVPLDKWIRKELKDIFSEYLFVDSGFFDLAFVQKLYDDHMSLVADNRFKLLRIFNFNYWYKHYYVY